MPTSFLGSAYRYVTDAFAGVGMVFGAALGVVFGAIGTVFTKVTGWNPANFFGGFKHTVLSSALGWGSFFAIVGGWAPGSVGDSVRRELVGPTIHDAAKAIGATATAGQVIQGANCGAVVGGSQIVGMASSWGMDGPILTKQFGSFAGEPFNYIMTPAGACTNGSVTVPANPLPATPGILGAFPPPP